MAETLEVNERLVQVGSIAYRSKTGEFLPAQAIYIKISDKEVDETGLAEIEKEPCEDIIDILADRFKTYIDGVKKAGLKV